MDWNLEHDWTGGYLKFYEFDTPGRVLRNRDTRQNNARRHLITIDCG